jgi:single-strand DNA-binding protein
LIGNIGKEPEFHSFGDGKELARFSVATSESWKDKSTGEWENKSEWHRVVVFNQYLVGVVRKHITQGTMVYIEGKLQTRSYEKDDAKHYITEVVMGNFEGDIKVLVRAADEEDMAGTDVAAGSDEEPFKDDIPF